MPVHIGKKIREEIDRQGFSVSEFARKINRSRNVAYDIFERESVDTNLLNKIGKTLNCDFFSLYSAQKEYSQEGIRTFKLKEPAENYREPDKEVKELKSQLLQLRNEISYLRKIISLLEREKKQKSPPRPRKKN